MASTTSHVTMAPSTNPRRIGFLYPGPQGREFDEWRQSFVEALKELAWVQGDNIVVEWRFAQYDQTLYAPLAADLARARVDALLTAGTPLTRALQKETTVVPIITSVGDPVGSGFAKSLAKPGGNITGLSRALREKSRKQITLLLEIAPTVRTLAILRSPQYGDISELNECLVEAAHEFGMMAKAHTVESYAEIEAALEELAGLVTGAAFFYGHGSFQLDPLRVAEIAIRNRVAVICDERSSVEAGGLMSHNLAHPDPARRFASLTDQVLRGADPGEIPFELPTKTEFVINRQTATSLGLVIPPELLLRADSVIG